MRFFNTAGPVNPADHYCLPPLTRFDLEAILLLIRQKKYFVLYAPRQTGKTSCLLALRDYLNQQGHYRCVYFNVEVGQSAREQVERALRGIFTELASRARLTLQDDFVDRVWPDILARSGGEGALNEVLTQWAEQTFGDFRPKPRQVLGNPAVPASGDGQGTRDQRLGDVILMDHAELAVTGKSIFRKPFTKLPAFYQLS